MYGYGEKINNRLEYIPREAGLRIPDPDPVGSGMFFLGFGSGIIIPDPDPTSIKTNF